MSEQLRESLSAAIDGEADAFELRRVLDEATHDEALRDEWHRLHLMRDVLREDLKVYQPGLRDYVWQGLDADKQLEDDVTELVLADAIPSRSNVRSPWIGRLTGTAVAAAVAVTVMFNGGFFDGLDGEVASGFADSTEYSGAELPGGEFATLNVQTAGGLEPVMYSDATATDQQRQNALMLHHIQQRAMNQAGVASFVKMATFNTTRTAPHSAASASEDQPAP